ncbi:DMT family transporter [Thioalkalicoccus limnaeus]|uniref:DMT family transporter n=1 Tax=Thioalkalicoccus limnaeus TaxID=120681 RepID=A0ABV4BF66_9GAMM
MKRHSAADWVMLLALTVMWGSSFLSTKVALGSLPFDWVVSGRLLVATIILVPVATLAVGRWPRGWRVWSFFVLMALTGNLLPFSLIAWGQQSIDSGLAGILMAVMPLATLSLAHFLVPGEQLTRFRVGGFLLGFVGVLVLLGPATALPDVGNEGNLLAMLAVLVGAWCYAVSAILARLRPPSDAVSTAAAVTTIAALMSLVWVDGPDPAWLIDAPSATAALLFLGVFSTAAAAVVYYRLIKSAGPSFVSQLNFLIPLWAVGIGILFLGESPQPHHLHALALILGGIALTQFDRRRPR